MKRLFIIAILIVFMISNALPTPAQDRGDRGDRRSGRGERGEGSDFGRGGGGFGGGGFGGPPGGFGGGGFGGPPGGFGGGGFGGPPGGFGGGGFGGPPGGFGGGGFGGGDRGSRFSSMMDSNGNGTIDQDEIDRMPSFVREMMRSRGQELKAGMSLDDMRNNMQRGFNGDDGRSGDRDQNDPRNANGTPVLTPYKMKPKKPVILSLPPAYSEVDTDFDGQLGLHEWMMTRRADLEQFDAMDSDHDGYLIPEELQAAESAAGSENAVASVQRKKLTIVGAPAAASRNDRDRNRDNGRDNNDNGSSRGGRDGGGEAAMAPQYFSRLDSDQNGTVDSNEWQQSQRVRGMFEQAGIPITDMNLDQFTANMTKLSDSSGRR